MKIIISLLCVFFLMTTGINAGPISKSDTGQLKPTHWTLLKEETIGGLLVIINKRIEWARKNRIIIEIPAGPCKSYCTKLLVLKKFNQVCRLGHVTLHFHEVRHIKSARLRADGLYQVEPGPVWKEETNYLFRQLPEEVRRQLPNGLPPWGQEKVISAQFLIPPCPGA